MRRTRVGRNVYRDRWGLSARVHVAGQTRETRYPLDTPLSVIRAWQDEARAALRATVTPIQRGTFADDVRRYLAAVAAMPTIADRTRDIQQWLAVFGPLRRRSTITAAEVQAQLARWAAEGLAASTLNHRRTALCHLWRVLDGRARPNPIADVPKFREPDAQPRGLPYLVVRRILAAVPEGATKARLWVMATTGLPHAQIARLTPADLDLAGKTLLVPSRRKGRGAPPSLRPLSPEAVRAFRAFAKADAWGPFSRGSLYRIFQEACGTLGLVGLRPYDLRHSFLTDAYRATGDLRVTQLLAQHSKSSLTERYTLAAVPPQVAAAVAKVERMRRQSVKVARETARRRARK